MYLKMFYQVYNYGAPKILQSDNVKYFSSNLFLHVCQRFENTSVSIFTYHSNIMCKGNGTFRRSPPRCKAITAVSKKTAMHSLLHSRTHTKILVHSFTNTQRLFYLLLRSIGESCTLPQNSQRFLKRFLLLPNNALDF